MRTTAARCLALACIAGACATSPVFEPQVWNASLTERNDSGARANARAASAPGQTAVAINLAGGQTNASHPWHVHVGTCGSGGAIVGDPAAYPSLMPNSAGAAAATAVIRVQLVPGEDYHVNVHRSPQALNEITACGELE